MDTTLSQVISLSKRFHPYRERSRDLRQTTLGRNNSFFERALSEKLGFGRANCLQAGFNTKKFHPRSTIHKTPHPQLFGGSPRGNPRQPSSTSQRLYGSPFRHDPSYTECKQTCRRENISVHTKLAQANPRSVGPGYCSGISSTSCSMTRPTAIHQKAGDNQQLVLEVEVQKLVEKGAAKQVQLSQVHLVSSVFVVPKSGEGWRPIIDLRLLSSFLEPPHFKMEGLYMLMEVLKQGWQMAKIDLKDVYLTIPVAREHHCLLSFQVQQGEWIQFQCLPFGLCTAPFVFTKVTKPIVQFLQQLGIHLIIYLDDLLLAASSITQLLQDLSTVLQLFTALGFLINYPKSIMNPTQKLEFLGFMVDTDNENCITTTR